MGKLNALFICIALGTIVGCSVPPSTVGGFNKSASPFNRNTPNLPPNAESGKCYAKCMIAEQRTVYSEPYAIYTGDATTEKVALKRTTIVLQPASTRWVKKKNDNCNAPNPDDCLVWCLEKVPSISEEVVILIDTTQSKNFELKRLSYQVDSEGSFTEWREVICANDISNLLIAQLQDNLRESGYYNGETSMKLDPKTKSSLARFQRENNLPIGQLDMQTVRALALKW